jgi:hypothetical protein
MGRKTQSKGRDEALIACLYRQAGRRWLMLAGALAVLLWLGFFAGHLRNPDAVKREWAVLISRVLAGAGGLLLARLLLFTYEERVPVLFLDLRSGISVAGATGRAAQALRGLKARGYVTVPLGDVVEFVREQRYVPKKCFGLVIEVGGFEEVQGIIEALPGAWYTILLPPEALKSSAGSERPAVLPPEVSMGLTLVGGHSPHGTDDLSARLEGSRDKIEALTRGKPGFARVGGLPGVDLRALLKKSGYACFLDGHGLNRFGDEPHMLRLLDVTPAVPAREPLKGLAMYIGLFKGKHYLWPVAAIKRITGKGPEGE